MGMLAEILSSKVRAEVFRLLFGVRPEELHMRELERRSGCAIGTIQTELKKLLRLGLVVRRRDGNRVYYRANREHPLYPDIRSIVIKTAGLVDVLRGAMEEESAEIQVAFVFGSLARHEEKAGSDIDLMVIGQLGLRKLTGLLSGVANQVNREINPHVMGLEEFSQRKAKGDHFVTNLLVSPKIFIKGNQDELEKLG
jgi:predicted nucleotidyltransferase